MNLNFYLEIYVYEKRNDFLYFMSPFFNSCDPSFYIYPRAFHEIFYLFQQRLESFHKLRIIWFIFTIFITQN